MLIAYRLQDRAVFLYGFAKSEQENISADELVSLRAIAAGWLAADDELLASALADGAIEEVGNAP